MALRALQGPTGGGAPVGGTGTTNTIPRWTGPSTLGDSGLIDDGSQIYTTSRVLAVNTTTTLGTGLIRFQVGSASALANYQGAQAGFMLPTGSGSWVEFCENSASGTTFRISKDASTGVVLNANGKNMGFNASGYTTAVASSQMVLLTSGNVGIGTASPLAPLDVRDATVSGLGVTSIYTGAITANQGGALTFGGYFTGTSPTTWAKIVGGKDNATAGDFGGHLQFLTRPNGGSLAERARITSTGNVGIGTASPIAGGLTVYGASNGQVFVQNSSGYTRLLQNGTDFYIDGNVSGSAGNIIFRRASSTLESARVDSAGNLILNTANTGATIQAAGTSQGLKLPATPGNADTQTLDCYQENYASNSWTPVIFGGTTAGTATYSVQEGFYTRWGNLIFCTATVVFSGHTGTGNLSLSGLPFAAKTAGSGTYRSSIIIEEGGGVKAILRLQSGTTATTTGVSIAASGNYVITFVYATN